MSLCLCCGLRAVFGGAGARRSGCVCTAAPCLTIARGFSMVTVQTKNTVGGNLRNKSLLLGFATLDVTIQTQSEECPDVPGWFLDFAPYT